MTTHISAQSVLNRYANILQETLRKIIAVFSTHASILPEICADLETFYGQISYHLGWTDTQFQPLLQNTGKLLRPTLLLLAYEVVGAAGLATTRTGTAHLRRALPAAAAIELLHNFTLMHDDIEDGDVERRHRSTAWAFWWMPFAINTGDGLGSLSRLALLGLLEEGIDASLVACLGRQFDRACLDVIEGQHLDLCFDACQEISIPMYQEMIIRKTSALMECATSLGANLGTDDQRMIDGLRQFGRTLGNAFQLRDDLQGIWASQATAGKTSAGDLYGRKKTLPVLHAFQQACSADRALLQTLYQDKDPLRTEQVAQILAILERTGSKEYCQYYLTAQCQQAHEILTGLPLTQIPVVQEAHADLEALVSYVEEGLSSF